jgi:hypothetical protein
LTSPVTDAKELLQLIRTQRKQADDIFKNHKGKTTINVKVSGKKRDRVARRKRNLIFVHGIANFVQLW